jgi:TetR/AcrR family fatty acid metabolism transcriptional regulator
MTDPIQQQLITARKHQILEAAALVFAEKGFHTTTIRDIAKRAGVADGTIYNYFDSKPALLLGIFERMRALIIQQNMPPMPTELDFPTFLRLFIRQPLIALKEQNFALFRIVISEMMVNEELRTLYYTQILAPTLQVAEGFFAKHAVKWGMSATETALTVRAISGMVLGLMLEYIMGDPTLAAEWDTLPDVLSNLLLHGVGAKPTTSDQTD